MSCSIPHSCFSPLSTLFWTDWNREAPKIESSSVDGQNRRVVVSDGVGLPNALTFDSSSGQVCWADAGKHHSHCDCCSTASTITGSKLQVYLLSTILKYCWTDQRFPQGPDEKGGFLRSRWQVIRIYWVHLWCSPSAGCSQSAGRLNQGAAVLLLRLFCVFRESTPSVGSLQFLFGVKSGSSVWAFFLLASFYTFCFPPDQWLPLHLWFLGPVFIARFLIVKKAMLTSQPITQQAYYTTPHLYLCYTHPRTMITHLSVPLY